MDIYHNLTIIIVCFKSFKLIEKNLEVLKNFKTIIVDNSSCDKTYNIVKGFDNIKFIKTSQNLGYGKANNLGVSKANTQYILILNPDIIVNTDAINTLYMKTFEYNDIGILAPSLYSENNERKSNGSKSFLKKKFFKKNTNINNLANGDTCYDYIIGCSFLMKRNLFNKVGGFDEDFFMYFEDNEFCDRINSFKKSVIEIPSSKMIHIEGKSSEKDFIVSCKLSIIHKVSEFIYLNKNFSKFQVYKILIIQLFDFVQRMFFNFLLFKFKKSFKNLLRIISILMYVTSSYKLLY
jgi:N-acetylglucosaminyl-diphospho-decaprenol L-rhamnosyltransferase